MAVHWRGIRVWGLGALLLFPLYVGEGVDTLQHVSIYCLQYLDEILH